MTLTEAEQARYDAFIAAARGFDAYSIAMALNQFTPGIDFRGSKRVRMAERFATAYGTYGYKSLQKLDPARLRRMLQAKKAGTPLWQNTK